MTIGNEYGVGEVCSEMQISLGEELTLQYRLKGGSESPVYLMSFRLFAKVLYPGL